MSARPTFLIVFFMLFYATVWSDDEKPPTPPPIINTDEHFSGEINTMIKSMKDTEQRSKYKQQLLNMKHKCIASGMAKGKAMGIVQGQANAFMSFFECGIDECKRTLEIAFAPFKEEFRKKETKNLLESKKEDLPADIQTIIESHDKWMLEHDKSFYLPTTTPSSTSSTSSKTTISPEQNHLDKVTDYFNKWLHIISVSRNKKKFVPLYLLELDSSLARFYAKNQDDYQNDEKTFLRKVAACYARSFVMMNAMAHRMMPKVKQTAKTNPNMQFPDVLFSVLPSWYMTEEDLAFINILLSAISDYQYFHPIKSVLVRNQRFKKPEENDWVVIPYDNSPKCGSLNVYELSTITPSNHKTYTPLYMAVQFRPSDLNSKND